MSNPYAPPPPGRAGEERPRPGGSADAPGSAAPGEQTPPRGEQAPPRGEQAPRPGDRAPGPRPAPGPPRPPVDPEAARVASRRVMHFGLLMLATLVTGSLPLPWQVASVLFALAAVVVGVRALISVWRSGLRGALVVVLAVGLGFAAVLTLSTVTLVALWPVQVERQDCLRDALTISARETCEDDFQQSLNEMLERAAGGGRPPADG